MWFSVESGRDKCIGSTESAYDGAITDSGKDRLTFWVRFQGLHRMQAQVDKPVGAQIKMKVW